MEIKEEILQLKAAVFDCTVQVDTYNARRQELLQALSLKLKEQAEGKALEGKVEEKAKGKK